MKMHVVANLIAYVTGSELVAQAWLFLSSRRLELPVREEGRGLVPDTLLR